MTGEQLFVAQGYIFWRSSPL